MKVEILTLGMGIVVWALLLAWLVEAVMEVLVAPLVDLGLVPLSKHFGWQNGQQLKANMMVKTWVASFLGILVAFAFGLNIVGVVAALLEQTVPMPIAGILFTGFVIGRGSQFVHDFFKRVQPSPA